MNPELEKKFTRYEIARILGARSLQLAMDAPVLVKLSKEEEEKINYDTLRIAEKEFDAEVLPITVKRPIPKKSEKQIKKLSNEEIKEKIEQKTEKEKKEIRKFEDKIEEFEEKEEKLIEEEGEIMENASPEDEELVEEKDVEEI